MTRINLLPWRETHRIEKNKEFYAALGLCMALACGAGFAGFKYAEDKVNFQNKRNNRLNSEIALLQTELRAIRALEETKNDLLSRMEIIQQLQGKRPQIVHTFDEIASRIPDGIYLTSMKQLGDNQLQLEGRAESNARVSALMRRMDKSDFFKNPRLDVISSRSLMMALSDTWEDLQNIDGESFSRIGTAPIAARGFLILLACAAVIAAMFHFMVTPQFDKLEIAKQQELALRTKFDTEQAKAANRSAYVEQLEEMKKTFNVMLRQLPNKTDIESLLVDLSQTSVASGLEVEFFKPENEISREFYSEYPISISVTGQYHKFGKFVSGLAALPRIVTLSNIDISDITPKPVGQTENDQKKAGNGAKKLKMDLIATTYRYIEEEE